LKTPGYARLEYASRQFAGQDPQPRLEIPYFRNIACGRKPTLGNEAGTGRPTLGPLAARFPEPLAQNK
jgi:hypothetical protein